MDKEREEALRLLPDAWGKLRANVNNVANLAAFEHVFFAHLDSLARQSAPQGEPVINMTVNQGMKCRHCGRPAPNQPMAGNWSSPMPVLRCECGSTEFWGTFTTGAIAPPPPKVEQADEDIDPADRQTDLWFYREELTDQRIEAIWHQAQKNYRNNHTALHLEFARTLMAVLQSVPTGGKSDE